MFILFFVYFLFLYAEATYEVHPFLCSLIKKEEHVAEIESKIVDLYKELIFETLEKIAFEDVTIENAYYFFERTFLKLDRMSLEINNLMNQFHYFLMVENNNDIKKQIFLSLERIEKFFLYNFINNKKIFTLLEKISLCLKNNNHVTPYEQLFIDDVMYDFIKRGVNLEPEQKLLFDKNSLILSEKEREFEHNIQINNAYISVQRIELAGLTEAEIENIEIQEDQYILRPDYPTYNLIMSKVKNRETREKYYYLFRDQGFPQNKIILDDIRAMRFQLAKLLGKPSFASFDLEDQMAASVLNVDFFLSELKHKTLVVSEREKRMLREFAKDLLQDENNSDIFPWDVPYIMHQYEKKYFSIDEDEISEFFPLEETFKKLFFIIESFFDISIEEIFYKDNTWKADQSVKVLELKKDNIILGHLLLDLFPREGKFKHFAFSEIVSGMHLEGVSENHRLGMIIGNFTPAKNKSVVLLKRGELQTLFHEFGHALHFFLSKAKLFSQAGTRVIPDFVEVPSRVFEQWPKNKYILKFLSEHYNTGMRLSDEIIDKIIAAEKANQAIRLQRQIMLSYISLYLFHDMNLSVEEIYNRFQENVSLSSVKDEHESRRLCSFGHLANGLYGPKYYSYLWAEIIAFNVLQKIEKENGFLNREVGQTYIDKIISAGGSIQPDVLLHNYFNGENYYSPDAFCFYINDKKQLCYNEKQNEENSNDFEIGANP